jgi:hypothetical protein
MKSAMAEMLGDPAGAEAAPADLERECEAWEWARAAGVSAQDLRTAVKESLGSGKATPAR